MKVLQITIALVLMLNCLGKSFLEQNILTVQNKHDPRKSRKAIVDLIRRTFPSISNIEITITRVDNLNDGYFAVSTSKDIQNNVAISLKASSAPVAVYGLHKYLMDYCNTTYTLLGSTDKDVIELKHIPYTLTGSPGSPVMFYGNPCVYSYSYWYWDWLAWERHIDWIVLRGFNLVLLPIGTEYVMLKVFEDLGLNNTDSFFTGQAYAAWSRMGNLKNLRGPLSRNMMRKQAELQRRVMKRMNELGLTVVLPAFTGFVPDEMRRVFPMETFVNVTCWLSFNSTNSCLTQLDPASVFFRKVGALYMNWLHHLVGTNHLYSGDMFNENTPTDSSLKYLAHAGHGMYRVLLKSDRTAVWLLQSWTFGYDKFWTNPRIEAYLSQVPKQNMLVLDMFAETKPMWMKTNNFFGKQFIWVMINNFGGNTVLNGNVRNILDGIFYAKSQSSLMRGTGFMPEGINQNPLLVDLFSRYSWEFSNHNDYNEKFLINWRKQVPFYRYKINNQRISASVEKTVAGLYVDEEERYNNSCIINKHPDFNFVFLKSSDESAAASAIEDIILFLKETQDYSNLSPNLLYDLINLVRDLSERKFYQSYQALLSHYYKGKSHLKNFETCFDNIKQIMSVLEEVTAILPEFRLACHLDQVKSFAAANGEEEEKLIYDFLLQITLWGENGEVEDYAFRMWDGMLGRYYLQRWNIFIVFLYRSLVYEVPFPRKLYEDNVFSFEKDFVKTYREFGSCESKEDVSIANLIGKISSLLTIEQC